MSQYRGYTVWELLLKPRSHQTTQAACAQPGAALSEQDPRVRASGALHFLPKAPSRPGGSLGPHRLTPRPLEPARNTHSDGGTIAAERRRRPGKAGAGAAPEGRPNWAASRSREGTRGDGGGRPPPGRRGEEALRLHRRGSPFRPARGAGCAPAPRGTGQRQNCPRLAATRGKAWGRGKGEGVCRG